LLRQTLLIIESLEKRDPKLADRFVADIHRELLELPQKNHKK